MSVSCCSTTQCGLGVGFLHAVIQAPGLLSASSTVLKAQSIQMHTGKEKEDQLWEPRDVAHISSAYVPLART